MGIRNGQPGAWARLCIAPDRSCRAWSRAQAGQQRHEDQNGGSSHINQEFCQPRWGFNWFNMVENTDLSDLMVILVVI